MYLNFRTLFYYMQNLHFKLVLLIISILMLIIAVLPFFKGNLPKESILSEGNEKIRELKNENLETILVLGTDSLIPKELSGWRGRSDLMVLVLINKIEERVSILSIPRDTQIKLAKYNISRINSANTVGGYKLSKRSVRKLLKTKVDHFVLVNLAGFKELLDSIGPMKIYVNKKMTYHDNSQDLHIEIEPGMHEMDSQTLINFLRYRSNDDGDIGRIKRQHIFFRAALRKMTEAEMIFRIPSILKKANNIFLTDMQFQEMFRLAVFLRSLDRSAYKSYIVPGDFASDGSWIVNYEELDNLMFSIRGISHSKNNPQKQIPDLKPVERNE